MHHGGRDLVRSSKPKKRRPEHIFRSPPTNNEYDVFFDISEHGNVHVEFVQAFHSEQNRRHELAAFLAIIMSMRTQSQLVHAVGNHLQVKKRIRLERKAADYASELHGCFCTWLARCSATTHTHNDTNTRFNDECTDVMSAMNMRQLPALYEPCYQHTITPWRRLAAGRVLTPIRLNRRSYERKTYNQTRCCNNDN